ncbi:unnamed protein product, partial [Gulo gulo]
TGKGSLKSSSNSSHAHDPPALRGPQPIAESAPASTTRLLAPGSAPAGSRPTHDQSSRPAASRATPHGTPQPIRPTLAAGRIPCALGEPERPSKGRSRDGGIRAAPRGSANAKPRALSLHRWAPDKERKLQQEGLKDDSRSSSQIWSSGKKRDRLESTEPVHLTEEEEDPRQAEPSEGGVARGSGTTREATAQVQWCPLSHVQPRFSHHMHPCRPRTRRRSGSLWLGSAHWRGLGAL